MAARSVIFTCHGVFALAIIIERNLTQTVSPEQDGDDKM